MAAAIAPIVAGAGSALGGMFSGKGAEGAAEQTAGAARDVASIQAASAAQALAFQKQAAAQDLANANVAALGNYNQYKARETALNALRTRIGAPAIDIPAFTPYQAVAGNSAPPNAAVPRVGASPTIQSAASLMAGPSVTMRAPNGQVSQVAPDQVSHYQALGAQVLNG